MRESAVTALVPDLLAFFAPIVKALPDDPEASDGFLAIDASTLPAPPSTLATSRLCTTAGQHWYGRFLADEVSIEGDKLTLRALGLLLFGSIFHPRPEGYRLLIAHPRATLHTLILECAEDVGGHGPGLITQPRRFNYYPRPVARHPWFKEAPPPHELPVATLANRLDLVSGLDELADRDVVVGFGARAGVVRLAELLLNAGRPSNEVVEFRLEAEPGFRGVGPTSAEIAIWLPGSLGFLDLPPDAFSR